MINALIKIIAKNQGHNWWLITHQFLYKEIYNILDWYNIIYTKDKNGIYFEYGLDLESIKMQDTIDMLEKLRLLMGKQNWLTIKNVSKNNE